MIYGGISDCDMEKGMVRCDVNVSVRPRGSATLGAKIEIKNMNSFSGVRKALEDPAVRKRIEDTGSVILANSPAEFAAQIRADLKALQDQGKAAEADLYPFQPDLIISDVRMPEMDGYESSRRILEHDKDSLIVGFTADNMPESRRKAELSGIRDFVTKPVRIDELKRLFAKYFKN